MIIIIIITGTIYIAPCAWALPKQGRCYIQINSHNKKVLRFVLKQFIVGESLMWSGRVFDTDGPDTVKERSPNFVIVLGMTRLFCAADRRHALVSETTTFLQNCSM